MSIGHSLKNRFRLLFDDASIKDMVNLCLPFGVIKLYVDHSIEVPSETHENPT